MGHYSTYTIFPGSSDPFYIVSYYIKWVTTSWTHSTSASVLHIESLVSRPLFTHSYIPVTGTAPMSILYGAAYSKLVTSV